MPRPHPGDAQRRPPFPEAMPRPHPATRSVVHRFRGHASPEFVSRDAI